MRVFFGYVAGGVTAALSFAALAVGLSVMVGGVAPNSAGGLSSSVSAQRSAPAAFDAKTSGVARTPSVTTPSAIETAAIETASTETAATEAASTEAAAETVTTEAAPTVTAATTAIASAPVETELPFREDNPAMAAAMLAARATLPGFVIRAADPEEGAAFLKVGVPSDNPEAPLEHIWMAQCEFWPSGIQCIVANEPQTGVVSFGEVYDVKHEVISDWMIEAKDGRIHGAYTLRAMLPEMTETEAASYTSRLAPLPPKS
ncbi:MAG: DUF2314 domain-containing protein [Pseudomonadota bacterium]